MMYTQQTFLDRYKYPLLFAICLAILLPAGISLLQSLGSKNKHAVEIIVVPRDARITANGSRVKVKDGKLHLKPGKQDIKAQKEGFEEQAVSIEVDTETTPVILLLPPVSAEAKAWAQKNNKLYLEAESRAGELAQKSGNEFRSNNPIVSKLPYRGGFYRIDYGIGENEEFVVQVTADSPVGRQVAIETIRSWGFEPSDYIIEFKQLDNPFHR